MTEPRHLDCEPLKQLIRHVPDFPKPGILFYDITTLLRDASGLKTLIDALAEHYAGQQIDQVVGIEARGFIFAPALAYRLGAGFVPIRKPKKLPGARASVTYDLEYGSDTIEIHEGAVESGHRVLLVDDLLATGGTMAAAVNWCGSRGAQVAGVAFAVELDFLHGREKLPGIDVFSLLHYND